MATLKIEDIHTQSVGGWAVVITGLNPTDHDFIVGTVDAPAMGVIPGGWNESGIMRGGTPDGNIKPKDPDIAELIALAKQLGAP